MKLTQISEGVKFGAAEVREVAKNKDLLVGIEYEFVFDIDSFPERFVSEARYAPYRETLKYNDIVESQSKAKESEFVRKQVQRWFEKTYGEEVQRYSDLFPHVKDYYLDVKYLSLAVSKADIKNDDDREDILETIERINSSYAHVFSEPLLAKFVHRVMYGGETPYETSQEGLNVVRDALEDEYYDSGFEQLLLDIEMVYTKLEPSAARVLTKQSLFSQFLTNWFMNVKYADEMAEQSEISRRKYNAYAPDDSDVDAVREYITNFPVDFCKLLLGTKNIWGIKTEDIKMDPSIFPGHGAEIISSPLPINQAEQHIIDTFAFIDEVGFTNSSTGLHINVSMKGKDMKRDLNVIKALILTQNHFMLDQFKVRGHVEDIFASLTIDDMTDIAGQIRNVNNASEVLDVVEKHFKKNLNSDVGINIFKAMRIPKPEQRRLEFRYLGDKDYHKSAEKMLFYMYRFAYMTSIAFDPDFGRKEYIQEVIKLLDQISKRYDYGSFVDLWRDLNNKKRKLP